MKLHLGCGQYYLEGYTNIDYPLTEHSLQDKSVADIQADITGLRYENSSVDEVRLHHVFEHFNRPISCALLTIWSTWLRDGGILRIEVPDFNRTVFEFLNPLNSINKRMVAERHLLGSQEAHWAVHFAAYSQSRLVDLGAKYGFKEKESQKNNWKGTYNIDVTFVKSGHGPSLDEMFKNTKEYLKFFLLDDSPMETHLLDIWLKEYVTQLNKAGISYAS